MSIKSPMALTITIKAWDIAMQALPDLDRDLQALKGHAEALPEELTVHLERIPSDGKPALRVPLKMKRDAALAAKKAEIVALSRRLCELHDAIQGHITHMLDAGDKGGK